MASLRRRSGASGPQALRRHMINSLQRAYDQVIEDVCLQGLPVVFALDGAASSVRMVPPTTEAFDISYLRHIPNMVVMSPKDENE